MFRSLRLFRLGTPLFVSNLKYNSLGGSRIFPDITEEISIKFLRVHRNFLTDTTNLNLLISRNTNSNANKHKLQESF